MLTIPRRTIQHLNADPVDALIQSVGRLLEPTNNTPLDFEFFKTKFFNHIWTKATSVQGLSYKERTDLKLVNDVMILKINMGRLEEDQVDINYADEESIEPETDQSSSSDAENSNDGQPRIKKARSSNLGIEDRNLCRRTKKLLEKFLCGWNDQRIPLLGNITTPLLPLTLPKKKEMVIRYLSSMKVPERIFYEWITERADQNEPVVNVNN